MVKEDTNCSLNLRLMTTTAHRSRAALHDKEGYVRMNIAWPRTDPWTSEGGNPPRLPHGDPRQRGLKSTDGGPSRAPLLRFRLLCP